MKVAKEIELAFIARKLRLVNPRGSFDSAGRWYDGEDEGPNHPNVRRPSRAWPYSYMVACRTKKWCRQLPAKTRKQDASAALEAIRNGTIRRDEAGRFVRVNSYAAIDDCVVRSRSQGLR